MKVKAGGKTCILKDEDISANLAVTYPALQKAIKSHVKTCFLLGDAINMLEQLDKVPDAHLKAFFDIVDATEELRQSSLHIGTAVRKYLRLSHGLIKVDSSTGI